MKLSVKHFLYMVVKGWCPAPVGSLLFSRTWPGKAAENDEEHKAGRRGCGWATSTPGRMGVEVRDFNGFHLTILNWDNLGTSPRSRLEDLKTWLKPKNGFGAWLKENCLKWTLLDYMFWISGVECWFARLPKPHFCLKHIPGVGT